MTLYKITARRINDRPDPDGFHSSGHGLPTFWVEAISAGNAAAIGHDVAGHGMRELTRTLVQAYREAEDGSEEYADSTWYWAQGRKVTPTLVNRRYRRNGVDITGRPDDVADASQAIWVVADGSTWLSLDHPPRGKWSIGASDHVKFRPADRRRLFDNPSEALYYVERRAGLRIVEVDKW